MQKSRPTTLKDRIIRDLRNQTRDLERRVQKLEMAHVTNEIRMLEKYGTLRKLGEFLQRCELIDLTPWAKRLKALRENLLLREVHDA